jgi:hypothetical protein
MGTSSDHTGGNSAAWSKARASGRDWASAGGGAGGGLARVVADAAAALAGYEGTSARAAATPALARIGSLAGGPGAPAGETLNEALRRNGLDDLTGRPPAEVHAALVDFIAGDPEDRDADLVRAAADEAVAEVLESAEDLDAIVIDEEAASRMMKRFVAEWLTRLITRELGTALVDQNPNEAERRSAEIREYVSERLADLTTDQPITSIDWSSPTGTDESRRILAGAREVFAE